LEDDGHRLLDTVDDFSGETAVCQFRSELVAKDGTCDGDTNDTTEKLEESEERRSLGDQFRLGSIFGLNSHERELEGQSETGTIEDLVADEGRVGGVFCDCEQETKTGDRDERTDEDEGEVMARKVDDCSGDERGNDHSQHEGDNINTRLGGSASLDLVEEREIVDTGLVIQVSVSIPVQCRKRTKKETIIKNMAIPNIPV